MAVAAAKGVPLSVRIASGKPYSRKRRWKALLVPKVLVDERARQPRRYRLKLSATVKG